MGITTGLESRGHSRRPRLRKGWLTADTSSDGPVVAGACQSGKIGNGAFLTDPPVARKNLLAKRKLLLRRRLVASSGRHPRLSEWRS